MKRTLPQPSDSVSARPPRLQAELDRMAAEHLRAYRTATHDARRRFWKACAECGVAALAGLVVMAFGFHVEGEELGRMFLYAGLALGYGGIGVALWRAYQRAEEDGDL